MAGSLTLVMLSAARWQSSICPSPMSAYGLTGREHDTTGSFVAGRGSDLAAVRVYGRT
jgi:hypothetical protein